MSYYMFYWCSGKDDERFLAKIEADVKTVKNLLDEYRSSDPEGYNESDFIDFIRGKGIDAEIIEAIEWIYF